MYVFWREWYFIREQQLGKVLRISCSFYYLVASTACFVHIMTIQVVAEREQKIQTEVKEIRKVFYCELCNKQYKLAMEFEVHLSSYDHNHRKVHAFCCLIHFVGHENYIWSLKLSLNLNLVGYDLNSGLRKWEKCMVLVVVMIGKNESNNVKSGRWLSLLRCILYFFPLTNFGHQSSYWKIRCHRWSLKRKK